MKAVAIIPARFASSRFPGKPLELLKGKPLIQWVYERASQAAGLQGVWVATDDARIESCVKAFGGKAVLTRIEHQTGTERLSEVAEKISADIFLNVQGDEPLIEPAILEATVRLVSDGDFAMASAIVPLENSQELEDRNVVKALVDKSGRALYFTRFAAPYSRVVAPQSGPFACWRHLGIYAYRAETLKTLARLPASTLELAESLEQLRALENGISIGLAKVQSRSFGIDTPQDLARMEALLAEEPV